MSEKSYRIRTNIGQDHVIKASLMQDIDFLEVLSLKINQENTYKLHVSNYGIIVGRVLANEAFGVPNAKVSVFIHLNDDDIQKNEIVNLYPYKTITSKDKENRRYNLLSDTSNDNCHRIVGTFPNKRLVLDNETEIEIYEKYWKYTTVTNQSGDYMIFGVPTGNQIVHVDIDLSDIGILSQKPRDFYYKGYNKEQFDNAEQFKEGTNLDNLTQLLSQNTTVYVYPFFGDKENNEIAITRCDIQVPYKFEPTCVFLGSIVSDTLGNHIGHGCGPSRWVGYNNDLTTREGTIEMIRKTPDGLVEEFPIKGNNLIDADGVWCYQIPMNLDYIGTDEFGNIIPVQDSKKGIPTRTSVRFRISMQETTTLTSTEHVAKYLVPNIHELDPKTNHPSILKGKDYNLCYEFGSATPKEYFRDLLWNKVYSIKNYIPRFERRSSWEKFINSKSDKNYTGIRSVNSTNVHNIFPYNSARFQLSFTYRVLCLLMTLVVNIIGAYNKLISEILCFKLPLIGRVFKFLTKWIKCIGIKGEWFFNERDSIYYFPRCDKDCGSIIDEEGLKVEKDKSDLTDAIQQALALEYETVNFDFHNDWVNGVLYMPLWFWKKRAKKSYFFGLWRQKSVNAFCSCDRKLDKIRLTQGCSTKYDNAFKPIDVNANDNYKSRHISYDTKPLKFGVIKEYINRDNLNVYYYAPGVPFDTNYAKNEGITEYVQLFATDIILLGSLNTCDLDNLPQTFNSLPSTTVNLPFIATFEQDESGDGVITGLDWGHNGNEQEIKYGNGLLMDLSCWNIATRYKSCVNLSRLSELHVTLDMDIALDDINEQNIHHDGLITATELVENETRAKFASLNHNGLTNLRKNITTNYDTYKFHYIYPVAFDGHLVPLEKTYSSSSYKLDDSPDSNYIMYRLGEGKDSVSGLRHRKHFYQGTEQEFSFPLYNNSFYFYFGLNNGKSAIDKFNSLYNATCVKQNKYAFTIDYTSKPGKWCYNTANTQTDFGTIDVTFNGLTDTFSYSLYNDFNELLISEQDVKSESLRFGYAIKEGGGEYIITNDGYKKDGRLRELKSGNVIQNSLGEDTFLENGVYYLEVTNSFGMKVIQKINMLQNVLTPNIEEVKLGKKYRSNEEKSVDSICGEMDYYGEIRIKSFIIDGEETFINDMIPYFEDGKTDNQPQEVSCKVTCTDGSKVYLILKQENQEENISNFVCYGVGNIPSVELKPQDKGIYTLVFNIWKPGDYVLTSNQMCNNIMNDNVSVNTISIENGENFQVYLNNIPLNVIYNDNFNNKNEFLSGETFSNAWLTLNHPNMYTFKTTTNKDGYFWEDFLDIDYQTVNEEDKSYKIISPYSKIDILSLQMNTIAEMNKMSNILGEENIPQILITSKGGKEPILIRNIRPNYSLLDNGQTMVDSFIIENKNVIEGALDYPYIVDKSYKLMGQNNVYDSISLNEKIYSSMGNNLGNYIALFTNNGGLINMNVEMVTDETLHVESKPESVNPLITYPPNSTLSISSLPQYVIDKDHPYYRSMFIDKRLTINGTLFMPIYCPYEIYENDDEMWKNGKWYGELYNVNPMIYDENYNIIGENLSYEIKKVGNGKTVYATTNEDYWVINKDNDFSNVFVDVISGKTLDELIFALNTYYCNDIACDFRIKSSGTSSAIISYYSLESFDEKDLAVDSDLRLVTHLKWSNKFVNETIDNEHKLRLFSCQIDIDGNQIDINGNFKFNITNDNKQEFISKCVVDSSNDYITIPMYGSNLSLNFANCKLIGDLTYEKENNKYTFKSYVEGGDLIKKQFDMSQKVNTLSFACFYQSQNNGKYLVYNNKQIFINNKLLFESYKVIYKNNKYYIINKESEIEIRTNDKIIYTSVDGNKYSGYTMSIHMVLSKDIIDELKEEGVLYNLSENDNKQYFYYYKDKIRDYLNKYGLPIYTNRQNNDIIWSYDLNDTYQTTISSTTVCYFGNYTYQDESNYKLVPNYVAIPLDIESNLYVIYSYRDYLLTYEPNVQFYNIILTKDEIYLPQLVKNEDNVLKKHITEKKRIINHYSQWEENTAFVSFILDKSFLNIGPSEVIDGDIFVSDSDITYIFEKNIIDKNWYVRESGTTTYIKLDYVWWVIDVDNEESYVYTNLAEAPDTEYDYICCKSFTLNGDTIEYTYLSSDSINDVDISLIPQINGQNEYMVHEKINYSVSGNLVTIQGVNYTLNNSKLKKMVCKRIDDFSCQILQNNNEDDNSLNTNAPILYGSVIKKYTFPQTSIIETALVSDTCSVREWVSDNTAIINTHPRTVVNGVFLGESNYAIYKNKFKPCNRRIPKHNEQNICIDKDNKSITWTYGDKTVCIYWWEVGALSEMRYEQNISKGSFSAETLSDITESVTKVLNIIEWEDVNYDKYLQISQKTIYEGWKGYNNGLLSMKKNIFNIEVQNQLRWWYQHPWYSIMDESTFECHNIQLQKLGDKYYYEGLLKIDNVLWDNLQNDINYLGNLNYTQQLPIVSTSIYKLSSERQQTDKKYLKKYFYQNNVIGEIYGYIDRLSFGYMDENKVFTLKDEYKNFPGRSNIGVQYGRYEPLVTYHFDKDNVISYDDINGVEVSSENLTPRSEECMGVFTFISDLKQSPNVTKRIKENDDEYENMIYVYQPNINNALVDGIEMVTCGLCKTINEMPTLNQSCHYHVGNIYISDAQFKLDGDDNYMYLSIYLTSNMNQEVKNSLRDGNLCYYFNGKKYEDIENGVVAEKVINVYTWDSEKPIFTSYNVKQLIDKIKNPKNQNCFSKHKYEENTYFIPINWIDELLPKLSVKINLTCVEKVVDKTKIKTLQAQIVLPYDDIKYYPLINISGITDTSINNITTEHIVGRILKIDNNIFKIIPPLIFNNNFIVNDVDKNFGNLTTDDRESFENMISSMSVGDTIIIYDERIGARCPIYYFNNESEKKWTTSSDINGSTFTFSKLYESCLLYKPFKENYGSLFSIVPLENSTTIINDELLEHNASNNTDNDKLDLEVNPDTPNLPDDENDGTNIKYDDGLYFIDYVKIKIEEQNTYLYEILCDDGYEILGGENDIITVIDSNGAKNTITYGKLNDMSLIGNFIYHTETIDGVLYEFVSKIQKMEYINKKNNTYLLKIPKPSLNLDNDQYFALSLSIDNLIYKIIVKWDGTQYSYELQ